MIENILNSIINWLEESRIPPVLAAIMIMLFAIYQILRGLK